MKTVAFFIFFLLSASITHAQLNVELLHQLVNDSQREHGKQSDARDRQAEATSNEGVNRTFLAKLKDKYRDIQSRFKTLGLAIDAAQIGFEAYPLIEDISGNQALVFELCKDDPVLIFLALDAEIDLSNQAYSLLNFLYGLALSSGDLNQMKPSDRKILFSHVLTELRRIAGATRGLASALLYSSKKKTLDAINPFSDFINKDKALIDDILRRKDILKN